jgi:hypothetical protein
MTSNITLALISDTSRDFFLNGNFRDSLSTFNIPEKKNFNKMMNSHSVSQNLKVKFQNCYNGFFKNDFPDFSNLPKYDFSSIKNGVESLRFSNYRYKKPEKLFGYKNYSVNKRNSNLYVKKKIIIDYLSNNNKYNLLDKKTIFKRTFKNKENNDPIYKKNSFKLMRSKVFGNGNSFLQLNKNESPFKFNENFIHGKNMGRNKINPLQKLKEDLIFNSF